MSALSALHFHNEEAAYAYVEARLWPTGPVCPKCGGVDRIGKLQGKSTRTGVYKCYQCRKPFTVKVGTVFEDSKIPMTVWLQAIFLLAASKKGMSSNQLHRMLGVTLKTAWFLSHRIREAMRSGDLLPMGADGGPVEADEVYLGYKRGRSAARGGKDHRMGVLSLVERNTGKVRSFTFDKTTGAEIHPIVLANVAREARLMTDEAHMYKRIGKEFSEHGTVLHGGHEYARGDITTNTVEGFFSIMKRGMRGVYQWCSERHLHRYAAEYDFRYTNRQATGYNDTDRADLLLQGVVGKRLTYGRIGEGR
jgi:transposase-like protein